MSGYHVQDEVLLFAKDSLGGWLEQHRRNALDLLSRLSAEEVLRRPHQQVAEEVIERYLVAEPHLDTDGITGGVTDERVDVSHDQLRAVWDRSRPFHVSGSRITLRVPYSGPAEVLLLRANTSTLNPPRASVEPGYLSVSRDVPADVLERDRQAVVASLRQEIDKIARHLEFSRADIIASNEQLRAEVPRVAEARHTKVLIDRDTEAMLGVPVHRNQAAAKSYRVQLVTRKRVAPARRSPGGEAFTPEPAITDADFADIIGDIVGITRTFERLAITYASMEEERLRDQILAMLGNVYGPGTGESFSKRGKADIYLPWQGGHPVFLAECKWWSGPKAFAEEAMPQLLDRYIVWRDTHTAMILFIRNKDATKVIAAAEDIIRHHPRYLRDADPVHGAPVMVLHKDGDRNREIKLALITAAIHE